MAAVFVPVQSPWETLIKFLDYNMSLGQHGHGRHLGLNLRIILLSFPNEYNKIKKQAIDGDTKWDNSGFEKATVHPSLCTDSNSYLIF